MPYAELLPVFNHFFRSIAHRASVQHADVLVFWHFCPAEERSVIQSIYKGIEIELEMHQQTEGYWKCDTMLITRPGRRVTLIKGIVQLPTLRMAKEYALDEARAVIDDAESSRVSVHEMELAPAFTCR
jgi:hypothetical protein